MPMLQMQSPASMSSASNHQTGSWQGGLVWQRQIQAGARPLTAGLRAGRVRPGLTQQLCMRMVVSLQWLLVIDAGLLDLQSTVTV
jgi:hypothetical protein